MSQIHTSPLYHLLSHHDHDLIIKEHLVNKAKQSLFLICNNSVFISYCSSTINNSSAPMMQSRGLQLTFNCSEAVLQLCCILLLDQFHALLIKLYLLARFIFQYMYLAVSLARLGSTVLLYLQLDQVHLKLKGHGKFPSSDHPVFTKGKKHLSSPVNQSTSIIHQETPDITGHLSIHSSIYNKQPHCKHVYTMTEELIYTVFNQMKRWTLQTWRL